MFVSLGRFVSRYPRWILLFWVVVTLFSAPFANRIGEVLTGRPGNIPGSSSEAVRQRLISDFNLSNQEAFVLVARSDHARVGQAAFDQPYARILASLAALPQVRSIDDHRNLSSFPLVAEDGRFAVAIIQLEELDRLAAQQAANSIRSLLAQEPAFAFDLAGGAATSSEIEAISARDAQRAEILGLPLSLVVLVIAFGAIVAAALPLIDAVASIVVSFAVLFALGQVIPFAVFTRSIVTMLGLAIGVDHALLMVSRFREELKKQPSAREAAAVTTATAGKAIGFSVLTTVTALSALLVPPLNFIRSIGIGTITVLIVGAIVSLTALPASLALLGHRVNWLRLRRDPGERSRIFWRRRAEQVMLHPWRWALGGTLLIVLLSVPALRMQVAAADVRGLSESTEARQVEMALEELGLAGLLNSYDIVLDFAERSGGFFHPSSVREVSRLSRAVAELDGASRVHSAMTVSGIPPLLLYQYYATAETARASDLADLVATTVSENGRYALLRVFPEQGISPAQGETLRQAIQQQAQALGVAVLIGGNYRGQAEWASALYADFPLTIGLVYLATFLLLGLAFRSIVVPIKSILLNSITVAASFGVLTLVFQHGIGAQLVGLESSIGFIDSNVPMFIFAILFGLSMDYEVFLVTRLFEAHERGLSDRDAVIEAISATGSVISSAAAIMVVVFSLFIFSEITLIKNLGLGLSVAVVLDAVLVRLALVPAFMLLAGKWNWWLPRPMARLAKHLNLGHE